MERATKTFVMLLAVALLTGCGLTPTQKKWAGFTAGVLIVGAIAAHDDSNGTATTAAAIGNPQLPCSPQPDGSCR